MTYRIRNPNTGLYLHSNIDSSGMSVIWSSYEIADEYRDLSGAESMVKRIAERYPDEKVEIVPHA